MRKMLYVTHQGPAMTLRVVILVLRKPIINQQGRAARQPRPQSLNPAFGLQVELGAVIGQDRHTLTDCCSECGRSRSVFKLKLLTIPAHAALHQLAVKRPREQFHRHRIQHFVGDDTASKVTGRLV